MISQLETFGNFYLTFILLKPHGMSRVLFDFRVLAANLHSDPACSQNRLEPILSQHTRLCGAVRKALSTAFATLPPDVRRNFSLLTSGVQLPYARFSSNACQLVLETLQSDSSVHGLQAYRSFEFPTCLLLTRVEHSLEHAFSR